MHKWLVSLLVALSAAASATGCGEGGPGPYSDPIEADTPDDSDVPDESDVPAGPPVPGEAAPPSGSPSPGPGGAAGACGRLCAHVAQGDCEIDEVPTEGCVQACDDLAAQNRCSRQQIAFVVCVMDAGYCIEDLEDSEEAEQDLLESCLREWQDVEQCSGQGGIPQQG